MKIVKLFLLLIAITGVFSNYQDLLQNNGNTKVTNVYYNHSRGHGHANVYITLENVEGSIKYHRLNEGKLADYNVNRFINENDDTTRYDPIPNLTLNGADQFYVGMDAGYQPPKLVKITNTINVRNCYSFADKMINNLTGQNVNYTQQYLTNHLQIEDNQIGNFNINATKRIQKRLRKENSKRISRKIDFTKDDNYK